MEIECVQTDAQIIRKHISKLETVIVGNLLPKKCVCVVNPLPETSQCSKSLPEASECKNSVPETSERSNSLPETSECSNSLPETSECSNSVLKLQSCGWS